MQLLGLVQTYFEIIHVVYFLTINFKGQGVASTNVDYLEQEHLDLWLFQLSSKKVQRSQNCWLEQAIRNCCLFKFYPKMV